MGRFINRIGKRNEFVIATKGKYFVDKTKLIEKFNKIMDEYEDRFVCITRPRRFGKTINALMLASYYSKNLDMKDIFDNLKIAKCPSYEKHLNKHNVIYISFSIGSAKFKTYDEYIDYFRNGLIEGIKEICPDVNPNGSISDIFKVAYKKTGEKFIFIIDEWDCIFDNNKYNEKDRKKFLRFLEDLLKDKEYVGLAYMTGILPIAKYTSGSGLNNFREYNAIDGEEYGEYFGFLQEEVEELCKKQDIVKLEELQEWYDGYCIGDGKNVYNPVSVVYALEDGKCKNYWTRTGKRNEILYYINLDVRGLKNDVINMMAGNSVKMTLLGYDAESKDIINSRNLALSAMTTLGFLSYHNGKIRIPNGELMIEFREMIANAWDKIFRDIVKNSRGVLQYTLDQNEERLEALIEEIHNAYNSYFGYGTENELSCVVAVAYLAARDMYTIKREDVGATGRADFAFYPNKITNTAFIIELKRDDTPEGAISQIKERQYFRSFKNFKGKKLLVGIAYDTTKKKHTAKIEEIE